MAAVFGTIAKYTEGEEWDDYVEQLDQYFLANDITDAEGKPKRRAVFLSVVGNKTYGLIKTLLTPEKPTSKTYEELVELVRNYVSPKPIVIAERYKFYNRRQRAEESVTQYLTELRKLSEHCEFGSFLNEALRDMFVIGLKDKSAQKKLLSERDLTIKTAVDKARSHEMASQQVQEMQELGLGLASGQKVDKVMVFDQQGSGRPTGKACYRCGKYSHGPESCFFKDKDCLNCKKKGHIRVRCPDRKSSVSPRSEKSHSYKKSGKTHKVKRFTDNESETEINESDTDSERVNIILHHIKSLETKKRQPEIRLHVSLNGKDVSMELDTGASVSLISRRQQKELLPNIELQPADITLRTITGEKVAVVGKCCVEVCHNGQEKQDLDLYVVRADGPALFGREWLSEFHVNWQQIHMVNRVEEELKDILNLNNQLFNENLGTVKGVEAELRVKKEARPRFHRARPIPYAIRDAIEGELISLVKSGVIEKIDYSDWAAPIVPVRKPNGKIRICGDYKVTINPDLEIPTHPMPRPDELFSKLNGGKKFTKLDLSQAYQQIVVDKDSRKYLTINTHLGLYQYKRLPFGISSAPAIFQKVMDKVLQGLDVGCYLDDLIVTGKDDQEHLRNLSLVLERLNDFGFRLQKSKCEFMVPSVTYLGVKVDSKGLHMDKEATRAVTEAPPPTNISELQSFLGLVNHYRKHVPGMSTLCSPLNRLLSKKVKWEWNSFCEEAFHKIKGILTSVDNVLVHYDPDKTLTLAVDASPVGLGAVISHVIEGMEHPIAYASRTLAPAERNYSQLEKEGLAIIFGLGKFHQYLYGRKFTLITDNKPLSHILGPRKGIPVIAAARIQRWALQLATYDYEIECRLSKQNANADALSRLPLPFHFTPERTVNWTQEATDFMREQINQLPVTAKTVSRATLHDPLLAKVANFTVNGWPAKEDLIQGIWPYFNRKNELTIEEGCLLWGVRTVIPEKFRQRIMEELHNNHPGIVRMKALARQHVWWPGLDTDIEVMVQRCHSCQEVQPKARAAKSNPWKWPSKPWQRLHIDFAGPFMGENFFIMVDAYSKWPEVHRMSGITANHTIEVMRNIFATHGCPEEVVSDNGRQFASEEFQRFLKKNNIKSILSAPYHPSSNGEAERFVRTFKEAMKANKSKMSWNHKIAAFLLSYRTTPHSTTHTTPSELLMGRRLRTILDALRPNLAENIQRNASKNLSGRENREIEVGEPVLARDYRQRKETWIAGVILKSLGPVTYQVQVGDLIWKRHIDQLRDLDGHHLHVPGGQEEFNGEGSSRVITEDLIENNQILIPDYFPVGNQIEGSEDEDFSQERSKELLGVPNPLSPQKPPTPMQEKSVDIAVRRSDRNRVKPSYLNDYV